MGLFSAADYKNPVAEELRRLNDNFERYLDHLKVPHRGELLIAGSVYVDEPSDEVEMAVREHAKLTGREMNVDTE